MTFSTLSTQRRKYQEGLERRNYHERTHTISATRTTPSTTATMLPSTNNVNNNTDSDVQQLYYARLHSLAALGRSSTSAVMSGVKFQC